MPNESAPEVQPKALAVKELILLDRRSDGTVDLANKTTAPRVRSSSNPSGLTGLPPGTIVIGSGPAAGERWTAGADGVPVQELLGGDLTALTTTDKTSLVAAINEVAATANAAAVALDLDPDASGNIEANEVVYERVDGSKKQIQAASDDVEAALADIDDGIGAAVSTLSTTEKTLVGAINEIAPKATMLTRELAAAGAKLELLEGTDNGTNKVTLQAPASLGANRAITVPDADVALADIALNTTHRTSSGADHSLVALVAEDGVIPVAAIDLSTNPSDGNTLTIGVDVFEFVDTAVNTVINDDTHIGVKIGAAAANTLASLVLAINGQGTGAADGITKSDLSPCLSQGTQAVLAVAAGTDLEIRPTASAPGGTAIVASPNLALSDGLTAAVAWNLANLNEGGGSARGHRAESRVHIHITTAMITKGTVKFEVQHAVAGYIWSAFAAGAGKFSVTDTVTEAGGVFTITLNGGVGDLANGDIISIHTWGLVS